MKKSIIYMMLLWVISSCNNPNSNNQITTDIVNNPKSASEHKAGNKGPILKFDTLIKNFGTIKDNTHAEIFFNFTNIGDENLVLANVQSSCGCTIPDWPHDPILPGKSSYIKASFDPTGKGTKEGNKISKSISVSSNSSVDALQTLVIEGIVVSKY